VTNPPAYDLAPLGVLLAVGAAIAALPVAGVLLRQRRGDPAARLRALAWVTVFPDLRPHPLRRLHPLE
jgi:hypothetical protein